MPGLQDMPGHRVTAVPMRKDGSIAAMSNPMFRGDPPYTGAWADCAYDPETPGPLYDPGATGRRRTRVLWEPDGRVIAAPTAVSLALTAASACGRTAQTRSA